MIFLNIYFFVVFVIMFVAGIMYLDASFKERKLASRMVLIAPIWPTMAPVFLWIGVRWLWRNADWRGIREEEEEERLKRVKSRW